MSNDRHCGSRVTWLGSELVTTVRMIIEHYVGTLQGSLINIIDRHYIVIIPFHEGTCGGTSRVRLALHDGPREKKKKQVFNPIFLIRLYYNTYVTFMLSLFILMDSSRA